MTHIIDHEQDKMWESVQTLAGIDVDQAKAVLKAIIERSLQQLDLLTPTVTGLRLSLPSLDDLLKLQNIEKSMRDASEQQNQEKTYEYLVDYIEKLSKIVEEEESYIRKKLFASVFLKNHKQRRRVGRLVRNTIDNSKISHSDSLNAVYYTPNQAAKKIGLSDQTIRRMCEKGKFKGAYKTDGGHWKIPQDNFITTADRDKKADTILKRIDSINKEVGEVDEFDL